MNYIVDNAEIEQIELLDQFGQPSTTARNHWTYLSYMRLFPPTELFARIIWQISFTFVNLSKWYVFSQVSQKNRQKLPSSDK